MSKVDRALAEKSLAGKGFERRESGDHIFYHHLYQGMESGIKTWVSHSKSYKDIGPGNVTSMKNQLKLDTLQQIKGLLTCPMTASEYNDILRQKGLLDPGE
jgi:hypothetical protein